MRRAAACVAGLLAALHLAPAVAARPDLALGGVAGVASLADPAATERLRTKYRVRLHIHTYSWHRMLSEAQRARIAALFKDNGPPDIELPFAADKPDAYFAGLQATVFGLGLAPKTAHVNCCDRADPQLNLQAWRGFVDAARRRGIAVVAPVFSPNHRGELEAGDFPSARWDDIRAAARYGGGLTLDAPPGYFLGRGEAYQRFAIAELRWARAEKLHTTLIISPHNSGQHFRADVAKALQVLRQADALPDTYVVENYKPDAPASYRNVVGGETQVETVAGVALWLAEGMP